MILSASCIGLVAPPVTPSWSHAHRVMRSAPAQLVASTTDYSLDVPYKEAQYCPQAADAPDAVPVGALMGASVPTGAAE